MQKTEGRKTAAVNEENYTTTQTNKIPSIVTISTLPYMPRVKIEKREKERQDNIDLCKGCGSKVPHGDHPDVCFSCQHKFCMECGIAKIACCPYCEEMFCQKCEEDMFMFGITCRQCKEEACQNCTYV